MIKKLEMNGVFEEKVLKFRNLEIKVHMVQYF